MSIEPVKQFPLDEEYKKPTGITPQDISKMREWLSTQPHLPGEHITDLDLILTYHCCGRSTEVAKQLLDNHYTTKTLFTNFFKDRAVDDTIETVFKKILAYPLPTRTKEGYAVLYIQFMDSNTQNFVFADVIKEQMMLLDLWQYEEGTWPGMILVANMDGLTLGHVSKFDFLSFHQYAYFLLEAVLLNLKCIHVVNAPSVFDTVMVIAKPFLKGLLKDRVHIHTGIETLEEFVPIDLFPREVGGKHKSVKECQKEVEAKMRGNKQFFVEENKKRVTEALRPGRPKTISDIFDSVDGTFKQLQVD